MAPKRYPLRIHLVVLVTGALLPLLLFSLFLTRRLIDDERAGVERRVLDSARAQMQVIDGEVAGTVRALQSLAQSERLDVGDFRVFQEQARRAARGQPSWDSVVLTNLEGRQVMNTSVPPGSPLPEAIDLESLQRLASTRAPVVGNLRRDLTSGKLDFRIRVPVLRGERLLYVLSATLTPAPLVALVRRGTAGSDEWTRAIVDAEGTIVARSRSHEQFVGLPSLPAARARMQASREGVYRDMSREGVPIYAAFTHSASGWATGIAVPAAVVDAPFQRSMTLLIVGGLGLLGVGVLAAFIVGTRISRAIDGTAAAAAALARGEPVDAPETGVAEIRSVSASLAQSAALLRARERERDAEIARADAARAEAEAADRAKDEFLAMLGHELRNPLAPALTALQLMRMRGETVLQRERQVLERQVHHLARLVDDLLDVSRVRRGRIELRRQPLELSAAVAKGVELATPVIDARRHRLTVDVPVSGLCIDGDETRLAQVVANLLTNAAKYSPRPGHIALRAHVEGREVVLECQDEGIGIAPELLPNVFDLFVQGERLPDRTEGGLGLGLALARTLVELHGGAITAISAGAGQGSTFVVRLPLSDSPVPCAINTVIARDSRRGGRVLLVDDNQDALAMLATALRFAGLEVETAADGADALVRAASFKPDAAVLDIGLPRMDGLELARRLRAAAGPALRLIALTGYGQNADVAATHAAGFDVHLVKPVTTETVLDALRPAASA